MGTIVEHVEFAETDPKLGMPRDGSTHDSDSGTLASGEACPPSPRLRYDGEQLQQFEGRAALNKRHDSIQADNQEAVRGSKRHGKRPARDGHVASTQMERSPNRNMRGASINNSEDMSDEPVIQRYAERNQHQWCLKDLVTIPAFKALPTPTRDPALLEKYLSEWRRDDGDARCVLPDGSGVHHRTMQLMASAVGNKAISETDRSYSGNGERILVGPQGGRLRITERGHSTDVQDPRRWEEEEVFREGEPSTIT